MNALALIVVTELGIIIDVVSGLFGNVPLLINSSDELSGGM